MVNPTDTFTALWNVSRLRKPQPAAVTHRSDFLDDASRLKMAVWKTDRPARTTPNARASIRYWVCHWMSTGSTDIATARTRNAGAMNRSAAAYRMIVSGLRDTLANNPNTKANTR